MPAFQESLWFGHFFCVLLIFVPNLLMQYQDSQNIQNMWYLKVNNQNWRFFCDKSNVPSKVRLLTDAVNLHEQVNKLMECIGP